MLLTEYGAEEPLFLCIHKENKEKCGKESMRC